MPDEFLRRRCRYHRSDPARTIREDALAATGTISHMRYAALVECPRCPGGSRCPNDGCVRSAGARTLIRPGGATTCVAPATGASVGTSSDVGDSLLVEGCTPLIVPLQRVARTTHDGALNLAVRPLARLARGVAHGHPALSHE